MGERRAWAIHGHGPAGGVTDTHDGRAVALADLSNRGARRHRGQSEGPLLVLGTLCSKGAIDRVRSGGCGEQQERDRRPRRGALGGSASSPGGERRQRLQRSAACTTVSVLIRGRARTIVWPSGRQQRLSGHASTPCTASSSRDEPGPPHGRIGAGGRVAMARRHSTIALAPILITCILISARLVRNPEEY